MNSSKKYENKYIKYKSKYLKIKNLIQKGGIIPNTLPLSLLAIDKSYFGMLVWLQLCNPQGVALFSFVSFPQRVPHPFTGVRVYEMSLTHAERLRVVGCGLKSKLVRQLSLGVGHQFEPHFNQSACHKMMFCITRRIASKQMAAIRNEAAKKAEEMCALGQCAAALIPLQQAIDMRHLPSRALMAWLLVHTREGIAEDEERAFQLVEEGNSLGCHHCQGVLAYCYYGGLGCMRNEVRSLEFARNSSDMGSKYGQHTLGIFNRYGGGGVALDNAQAVVFFQMAAAQGLAEAQFSLGHMYYFGENVTKKNYAEALRWFHLAATQGYPPALYFIALCHEYGQGVATDVTEAIRWYIRAQAAGDSSAEYQLDRLFALE
jgi:TPR repeat protein